MSCSSSSSREGWRLRLDLRLGRDDLVDQLAPARPRGVPPRRPWPWRSSPRTSPRAAPRPPAGRRSGALQHGLPLLRAEVGLARHHVSPLVGRPGKYRRPPMHCCSIPVQLPESPPTVRAIRGSWERRTRGGHREPWRRSGARPYSPSWRRRRGRDAPWRTSARRSWQARHRPTAIAFRPNGDLLVAERGGAEARSAGERHDPRRR